MKKLSKNLLINILVVSFVFVVFGLTGPMAVQAATSPDLGAADTFNVLAQSGITGVVDTPFGIIGNVENNGIAAQITALTNAMVNGTIYSSNGLADIVGATTTALNAAVQDDAATAYGDLDAVTNADANCIDPSTGLAGIGSGVVELGGRSLAPGLYCSDASFKITGILTLTGTTGTWVFKAVSTIDPQVGSSVTGGDPCNVWWRSGTAVNVGNSASFIGTIIAGSAITFGTNFTLDGRALAIGTNVTFDGGGTISGPTCSPTTGTLNIIKDVVGGTATSSDFIVSLKLADSEVGGGPFAGTTTPGTSYSLDAGTYVVSETSSTTSSYIASYSGACNLTDSITLAVGDDVNCTITNTYATSTLHVIKKVVNTGGGVATSSDFTIGVTGTNLSTSSFAGSEAGVNVTLSAGPYTVTETGDVTNYSSATSTGCTGTITAGQNVDCTIINTYTAPEVHHSSGGSRATPVAPIINVVKVASPSILAGPGPVTYTYTLHNTGTVPVSNVTMVDDTCSPMIFVSGDKNSDSELDVNETWTYDCFKTVSSTHTNIVTATGWANGLSATDTASATVVVGVPIVLPTTATTSVVVTTSLVSIPSLPKTGISTEVISSSVIATTTATTSAVVATSSVFIPSLPNTGINTNWIIGVLTGLFIIMLIALVSVLRKRIM